MTRIEFLISVIEDIIYAFECWIGQKSEAFNAMVGAALCFFLWLTLIVGLMFPQLKIV